MNKQSKIYVAGHTGLVGSALVRLLHAQGFNNVETRTHNRLDLTKANQVDQFFKLTAPEYVFMCAGLVGGIGANNARSADFCRVNAQIAINTIDAAARNGCRRFMYFGSSCIYPRAAKQPITEDALMTGPLEKTNDGYAVAKIAGLTLLDAYRRQYGLNGIAVMPTNLYGPCDNFDLETAHVLPAMMRRFHEAKESQARTITLWGDGSPLREFLHVDDLAAACVMLMAMDGERDLTNIGSGHEVSIKDLAAMMRVATGFQGNIWWDTTKPNGTPRKLLDSSRIRSLGWTPKISLERGIVETYRWYKENQNA